MQSSGRRRGFGVDLEFAARSVSLMFFVPSLEITAHFIFRIWLLRDRCDSFYFSHLILMLGLE